MAKITRPLPPDNVTMRTHIIEACLPHLSLADVEALLPAVMQRLAALRETRRRLAQEAHYAQLRELPEGTLVEYIGYDAETFARGEIVPLGRALRKPSTRIQVSDRNGKLWRMPIEYLRCLPTEDRPV